MEQNGIALAGVFNGESARPQEIATRSIAGVIVLDTPLVSRARFVPGYKCPSAVDLLMNSPFVE
jgi:hypothetical protein